MGHVEQHLGNLAEARRLLPARLDLRESEACFDEAGDLTHLGDTHYAAGELAQARAWQQALAILEDLDHPDVGQVRAKLASTNDHAFRNPPA